VEVLTTSWAAAGVVKGGVTGGGVGVTGGDPCGVTELDAFDEVPDPWEFVATTVKV
jgi:hypothetical protein